MKMSFLGKTGVKISEISLGILTFNGSSSHWNIFSALDRKEARILVDMALDTGKCLNLVSTWRYSWGLYQEYDNVMGSLKAQAPS